MIAVVRTRAPVPWWLILIEGIALVILGLLLLTSPMATAVVVMTFLGAYWLVNGIFDIVAIFVNKERWYWSLILGILGIVAGLIVLQHPVWSTILAGNTLVILLGVWALAMGIVSLIRGFQGGGAWAIILGILNILVGLWLILNPLASALALPIVLGFFGLVGGVLLIYVAWKNK